MADTRNSVVASGDFREAVCIDGGRVYDSCCARDCLEDLRVYFSPSDQRLVDDAVNIRSRGAEVCNVVIDVEPVNLNRGFYSCCLTFYFLVRFSVFCAGNVQPDEIVGIASFDKTVILYGSEGKVRTFTNSGIEAGGNGSAPLNSLPKCVVQAVDPVNLGCRISPYRGCDDVAMIPQCVLENVGGTLGTPSECGGNGVYVTLGLFTVVQLIRNVQMLIPVYDFCVPEKECENPTTDNPCEVFSRIGFPTEDFFPPRLSDIKGDCCQPAAN